MIFETNKPENNWREEWKEMPEYNNKEEKSPLITATFKFRDEADFAVFLKLIKKHLYNGERPFDGMQKKTTKSTWFPLKEKASNYCCVDES